MYEKKIYPLVFYNPLNDGDHRTQGLNGKNEILLNPVPDGNYESSEFRENLQSILSINCSRYDGVGLAANQIGLLERVFYYNSEVYFNPHIVKSSDTKTTHKEGCLSLPKVNAVTERSEQITLKFININGEQIEKEFFGFDAIAIQHEMDHLNGQLYVYSMYSSTNKDITQTYLYKKFWEKYKKVYKKLK